MTSHSRTQATAIQGPDYGRFKKLGYRRSPLCVVRDRSCACRILKLRCPGQLGVRDKQMQQWEIYRLPRYLPGCCTKPDERLKISQSDVTPSDAIITFMLSNRAQEAKYINSSGPTTATLYPSSDILHKLKTIIPTNIDCISKQKSSTSHKPKHPHKSPKMTHHGTTRTTRTTTTRRHGLFGRRKVHHQKRKATMGDKIAGAMKKLKGTILRNPGEKVSLSPTHTSIPHSTKILLLVTDCNFQP